VALSFLLIAAADGSRLSAVSGAVELGRGEPPVWQIARSGDLLDPGDAVRTGADGRAEIELGAATVRLYPNSLLRVPLPTVDPAGAGAVEMERGTSLFDVLRGSDEPFEVRTPEVVVSVKGTRFSIALAGNNAAVAVFRGVVGVRSQTLDAAHEALVREGFLATGRDTLEVMAHGLDDPWRAWSSGTLPQVPTPALETVPTPAKAAASQALDAARTAARREALERAAERHPEVERRVLDARKRQQRDAANTIGIRSQRDPVADRSERKFDRTLEKEFVERWLNHGEIDRGSDLTFELTLIDGNESGSTDRVKVGTSTGDAWTLDEDQLRTAIAGQDALPTSLVDVLQTEGIDEMQFTEQMLTVLDD
jgi:hypothetical protein